MINVNLNECCRTCPYAEIDVRIFPASPMFNGDKLINIDCKHQYVCEMYNHCDEKIDVNK